MKKYAVLSTMFLTLLFGFQNCTPTAATQSGSDTATGVSQSPSDGASQAAISGIQAIEVPSVNSTLGFSGKPAPDSSLLIDVEDGHIDVADQNGNIDDSQRKCLSNEELSEVRAILATGQICQKDESTGNALTSVVSDRACAQIYKFPYAKLHKKDGQEEINLGEARSSCSVGPDLCGEHKDLLKAFLKAVVSDLARKDCKP